MLLAAAATLLGTGLVRRFALAYAILDVPNARSSHTTPTPRGGGLAIVGTLLIGTFLGGMLGAVPFFLLIPLIVGGIALAVAGWIDDRRGLSVRVRLVVQVCAACIAVLALAPIREFSWNLLESALACLAVVWFINLYNFMDGSDGLAATEACVVSTAAAFLMWWAHPHWPAFTPALLLAGAAGGFLWWNWSPARIFMGDVGSGVLGFWFATLALIPEDAGGLPLGVWAILLAIFVTDATVTLLRRFLHGEVWYAAHRSHAYQRAIQYGYSHGQVAGTVAVGNLCFAGIAWWAMTSPALMIPLVIASYMVTLAGYCLIERVQPMWPSPILQESRDTVDEEELPATSRHLDLL